MESSSQRYRFRSLLGEDDEDDYLTGDADPAYCVGQNGFSTWRFKTMSDRLVAFMCLLARDTVAVGEIERLLAEAETAQFLPPDLIEVRPSKSPRFSSSHLEALAREWSARLERQ